MSPPERPLSPDGRRLAVVDHGDVLQTRVRTFDLATGQASGPSRSVDDDVAEVCPLSWRDGSVVLPTLTGDGSDSGTALVTDSGGTVVAADPRLGLDCSLWASEALAGDPHRGLGGVLFGDRTGWLSWHWREVGLATAAVVLAGALLVVRRRRRRVGLSG